VVFTAPVTTRRWRPRTGFSYRLGALTSTLPRDRIPAPANYAIVIAPYPPAGALHPVQPGGPAVAVEF
jgi:hypothetical protein